jgi:hypothetical protein
MVVGGFSKSADVATAQGLLKDVELISTTPNNIWSDKIILLLGPVSLECNF